MDQPFKDKPAEQLGIPKDVQDTLDVGSDHPFMCKCETCRQWWIAMGPYNFEDADKPGFIPHYGPFTQGEIEK